jgi:hypothetical protein
VTHIHWGPRVQILLEGVVSVVFGPKLALAKGRFPIRGVLRKRLKNERMIMNGEWKGQEWIGCISCQDTVLAFN